MPALPLFCGGAVVFFARCLRGAAKSEFQFCCDANFASCRVFPGNLD